MPNISQPAEAYNVNRIKYGGWEFPVALSCNVSITPIYDSTNRYAKYRTITVNVECVITPDLFTGNRSANGVQPNLNTAGYTDPADTSLAALNLPVSIDKGAEYLRKLLSTPGLPLQMTGTGFGNILINNGNDLNFGPKPTVVSFAEMLGRKSFRLVWSVTTTVPDCLLSTIEGANNFFRRGQSGEVIGELNYGFNINYSRDGLLTRQINGIIEAFVYADNSGVVYGSATTALQYLKFDRLPNFHREESVEITPDRRFANFSITDTMIPSNNPYPPNISNIDLSYSVQSTLKSGGFNNWNCSLSGSITVLPGVSKWWGIIVFGNILNVYYTAAGDNILMVNSIELSEEVFGLTVSATYNWTIRAEPRQLLNRSGFALPGPYSWIVWANSLTKYFDDLKVKGVESIRIAGQDEFRSYCNAKTTIKRLPGTSGNPSLYSPAPLAEGCPPCDDNNYLEYHNSFSIKRDSEVIYHKNYGTSDADQQTNPGTLRNDSLTFEGQPPSATNLTGSSSANYPSASTSQEYHGDSLIRIEMEGSVLRVGCKPDIPGIVDDKGVRIKVDNEDLVTPVIVSRDAKNCPIYHAKWLRVYYVTGYSDNRLKQFRVDGVPLLYQNP